MSGTIVAIRCEGLTALTLTLESQRQTIDLYARDLRRIEYRSWGWTPPPNFDPCVHLAGLKAQIGYTRGEGQAYAGEIISIEIRE